MRQLAILLLWPVSLCAQNAQLSGLIKDPSEAGVPKASVVVISEEKGVKRTTSSNDDGYYNVPALQPGTYKVTVQARGFQSAARENVKLDVAQNARLDFTLQVGSVEQTITVAGEAPMLNTESPAVSTVVGRQFVENIPLNGRSFQGLIALTPGIVVVPASFGNEGQFSANGQRSDTNYFMVDGVGANIGVTTTTLLVRETGGTPGFNVLGTTSNLVSVDAMQEFRIQTSSFAPEFGHSPGAQISISTRSGSNQFHGSAFNYFRNDVLDANDWFADATGLPKARERQNDFGGVLGGPIIRDRTFFFFSYEGLRLRSPRTALTTVPSLSARQSAPPAIQPFLNAFPLPNGPEFLDSIGRPTGQAPFNASISDEATLNATSIRVDETVNSKLTFFGRYNQAPSEIVQRGGGFASLSSRFLNSIDTKTLTLGSTQIISPRITNDFRFNYSRNIGFATQIVDTFGGAVVPSSSVFFPPPLSTSVHDTNLDFQVSGGQSFLLEVGDDAKNVERQFNFVDNLSLIRGSHALKCGADYRLLAPIFNPLKAFVVVTFPSVPSAVAGKPSSVRVDSQQPGVVHWHNLGLFAQDTWKVTPRLTLTYGLRWELNPPPSAGEGLKFLAASEISDPATLALAPLGTPPWKTTYNNFAPRGGLAYQLRRTPGWETVVRGGLGVFFDLANQASGRLITNVWPFGASKRLTTNLTFPLTPDEARPPDITPNPPFSSFTFFDPNLKLPYTLQWNVALEQSLGSNQTLSASYVAAVGRRLLQTQEVLNPNPNFGILALLGNHSTSDYHALQVQYQRRLSRGVQALASYTWSHSIDTASNTLLGFSDFFVQGQPADANRGPSSFDIRHSLAAAVTYNIPAPRGNAAVQAVLRGWSMDSLIQARSAPPVDLLGSSSNLLGQFAPVRPDLIPGVPVVLDDPTAPGGKRINRAAFSDPPFDPVTRLPLRQGTLGRDALRAFGATQWDWAVHRQFSLKERVHLQFRAEFFNILNHPNFGPPSSAALRLSAAPAVFGRSSQMLGRSLTSSGSPGTGFNPLYQIGGPRSIQLALKLLF